MRQADPRIRVIAAAFCRAHTERPGPCGWCSSRARDAVRALDDVPTLFDPQPADPVPLTDPGLNRQAPAARCSDTSKAAALAVFPKTGTQRLAILEVLHQSPGRLGAKTDEQLADRLGLSLNTVRPRRGELVAGGWLCDSGRTAPTKAGNQATRWALTPQALTRLAEL